MSLLRPRVERLSLNTQLHRSSKSTHPSGALASFACSVDDASFFASTHFSSGDMVAAGIKPTTLLFANAEIPRAFIDRERRDLPRPTAHLIGTDNQGQFRTSYAKEYPEGMCLCLAAAFWDKIHRTFGSLDDLSSAFPPLARELAAMAACVDRGTMRPDYQPQWRCGCLAWASRALTQKDGKKNIYIYIHDYIYIYLHKYVYIYIYIHLLYDYIRIYIYLYIYIHMYIIHMYIYMYLFIYVLYICVYM